MFRIINLPLNSAAASDQLIYLVVGHNFKPFLSLLLCGKIFLELENSQITLFPVTTQGFPHRVMLNFTAPFFFFSI
jgi:hypothetical protein